MAVAASGRAQIVRNGASLTTPCAVAVDHRGLIRVGAAAEDMKSRRSARVPDVMVGFRLLMGSNPSLASPGNGIALTPELATAALVSELRRACVSELGFTPRAASISVPVEFNAIARSRTRTAALIAGFEAIKLIEEPVAAVLGSDIGRTNARADWLVVHFSRTRASASVVRGEQTRLAIAAHEHARIGGADLDWKLVDEWMVPKLTNAYSLSSLARGPEARDIDIGRMLVLKRHAENIKEMLSNQDRVEYFEEDIFTDDDGTPVDLECMLARERFESLAAASAGTLLGLARSALQRARLSGNPPARLIMHGGGVRMPLIQRALGGLGLPALVLSEPQHVVAKGAALHARSIFASHGGVGAVPPTPKHAIIQLEYEPVARQTSPFVGGKLEIDGKAPPAGTTVLLRRDDDGWSSGALAIDSKGMFFATLKLREAGECVFSIEVQRPDGQSVPCNPKLLSITLGADEH